MEEEERSMKEGLRQRNRQAVVEGISMAKENNVSVKYLSGNSSRLAASSFNNPSQSL